MNRYRVASCVARYLLIAVVVYWAGVSGLRLREKAWDWTQETRFWGDIGNAFRWGKTANEKGLFSIYERLGKPPDMEDRIDRRRQKIDYAPGRLALMTYWVDGLKGHYTPEQREWREPEREHFLRSLRFNLGCEIVTALGAFLVARHVSLHWRKRLITRTGRTDARPSPRPSPGVPGEGVRWIGALIGLGAALVTWFNPVIIFNAEAWPQWDIWPMPFFVLAMYCALRRWWLIAGMLIGLAPALKGQILTVAWTLPVAALVAGEWRGAIRLIVGGAFTMGLIGLPWEISRWDPYNETLRVFDLFDRVYDIKAIAWIVCLTLGAILIPRKLCLTLVLAAAAIGMWSTYWLMRGNDWWLGYSFGVGTEQYAAMTMGPPSNLAALLAERFGWPGGFMMPWQDKITNNPHRIPWLGYMHLKTVLLILFFSLSGVCAIIAGVHYRRRDPRWIVAICMPWLLFYAIPAQIHERYLLYFSACAGMFLACGSGWFLMGLLLTVLAFIPTIHASCGANGIGMVGLAEMWEHPFEAIHRFCAGTHPGTAWMLLLAIAIMLYGLIGQRMRGGAVRPT